MYCRESSTVGSNTQLMNHEQQNINETYRANLYQAFHKIANSLVDKKTGDNRTLTYNQ